MPESPVAADAATLPSRGDRAAVANVVLASIVSALHVGKATIVLPSLQHEFGGSLALPSGIMPVFPFGGVFGGIAACLPVRHRRRSASATSCRSNDLGQVVGPPAIGAIVGAFGWSGGIRLMLAAAVTGAAIGLSLPREPMGRRWARRRSTCTEIRQACSTPWKA